MFDKNIESTKETDTAFAFAVLLLNLCVLAAAFGIGWLAYWLIVQMNQVESLTWFVSQN